MFPLINPNIKTYNFFFLTQNTYLWSRLFVFLIIFNQLFLCPNLEVQAFFSPGGNITGELVKRIAQAKKTILAAVYTFTDLTITQALVDAKKRGVDVRIILDRASLESPWGKSKLLINAGVGVFCKNQSLHLSLGKEFDLSAQSHSVDLLESNQTLVARGFGFGPIMHHKYAVFDNNIVWTGSFNWTISANSKNNENVLVLTNAQILAGQFAQNFQTILTSCTKVDVSMIDALIQKNKDYKQALLDKKLLVKNESDLFGQRKKLVMHKSRKTSKRSGRRKPFLIEQGLQAPTVFA